MRSRLISLVAAAVVLAAGCAVLEGDPRGGAGTCARVEPSMCARILAEVRAREEGTATIFVECATGPCDVGEGEVAVAVRRAKGTGDNLSIGWSAAGLPPGLPFVPTCEAMKVDACIAQAQRDADLLNPGDIVAMHLRCHRRDGPIVCNIEEGEGSTRTTLRDGSTIEQNWAYAMAPAPAESAP